MISQRFSTGQPWRFVLTTLAGETVTSLERLASNRTVTFTLNQPAQTAGQVPSDDPRVNITDVEVGLDAPHLSFADRLIYGFRREQRNPDLWVCRFSGIPLQIEDAASSDQPYSNYTAYDPWQYLYGRALKNFDGSLVGVTGLSYSATAGDLIVAELINNTITTDGECHVDLGSFEATAAIDINFQQGTSVGDALKQLVQTGTLDIWFEPIYDTSKPGICCSVHVYAQKGTTQDSAPFAWDTSRFVNGISNLLDGAQLANTVQFYNGQGGPPVLPASVDASSVSRYGVWEAQQFFPAQIIPGPVMAMAALQLDLRKQGRRSVTITPNPLLSPKPFIDYSLGDKVPVYATTRLRQEIPWSNSPTVYQRIYGIPITLGDDGVESVQRLVASPDGFT